MDKYYFEGISKAGKPRIRFVRANIGDRQFYLIASMSVPLQVGIYLDNFTVSLSSQYKHNQQLGFQDIIINIPSRPYQGKNQQTGQEETRYDAYLKFDSFDLRYEFIEDLKKYFLEYWAQNNKEYYDLQNQNNQNSQGGQSSYQSQSPPNNTHQQTSAAQAPSAGYVPQQQSLPQQSFTPSPPTNPPPQNRPGNFNPPPSPPSPPSNMPPQQTKSNEQDMLHKYGPANSNEDPNDDLPF
jgi:hypothetical protein